MIRALRMVGREEFQPTLTKTVGCFYRVNTDGREPRGSVDMYTPGGYLIHMHQSTPPAAMD